MWFGILSAGWIDVSDVIVDNYCVPLPEQRQRAAALVH